MPAPQMGMMRTKLSLQPKTVMMEIHIKDPITGLLLYYQAKPCENEREQGWSVLLPNKNSIFIIEQQGNWKVRHDDTVNPETVKEIGKMITNHLAAKKITWEDELSAKNAQDHRETERLLREQRVF